MKPIVEFISKLLRFHKLKIAALLFFTLIFLVWLFPFGDLSDLVTNQVADATNGSLYLQFDDMSVALAPGPGVELENVTLETSVVPTIHAESLAVAPWILGALRGKPGAIVNAAGLFGGSAKVNFRQVDENRQDISIAIETISLPQLSDFLRSGNFLALNLQGSLNMASEMAIDPQFQRQPSGHVGVQITNLSLPGQTIQVPFNGVPFPVPLPELGFGRTNLQAKVNEGQLDVQELTFGDQTQPMSGQIRGTLGLSFERRNPNAPVRPLMSAYDFRVELTFSKEFHASNRSSGLGAALGFLEPYKQETPSRVRYAFRARGRVDGGPPQLSSVQ